MATAYRSQTFFVYRLNHKEEIRWEQVETLCDRALFLDRNHSVSVSVSVPAREHPGYEENSIYFIGNLHDYSDSYNGLDIGVYNLEDDSVKLFHRWGESKKIDLPPFWFIPNL